MACIAVGAGGNLILRRRPGHCAERTTLGGAGAKNVQDAEPLLGGTRSPTLTTSPTCTWPPALTSGGAATIGPQRPSTFPR